MKEIKLSYLVSFFLVKFNRKESVTIIYIEGYGL